MSPDRVERFSDVTVDNFRALMKRLQVQHPRGWPASTGERLYWREKEPWDDIPLGVRIVHPNGIIDKTLPTEKTWDVWRAGDVVSHRRKRPKARIYAFEERANLTRVIFQDGAPIRDEPTEKIGLAFEEFAEVITEAISAERKPKPTYRRQPVYTDTKKRRQKVKELCGAHTIFQMAQRLGCSESTIKRDIRALKDQGEIP